MGGKGGGVVDVAPVRNDHAPTGHAGTAGTNVGGTTVAITIAGDMITVDVYPVGGEVNAQPHRVDSIGAALQAVLDVYERQEPEDLDGDRAFDAGFRGTRTDPPSRAPKPGPGAMPPIRSMR